ncbi:2,3,4,5-tetrahydropyridine-2,6-dicarboxylate N-succinyltransferase [Dirofilaria immitis]
MSYSNEFSLEGMTAFRSSGVRGNVLTWIQFIILNFRIRKRRTSSTFTGRNPYGCVRNTSVPAELLGRGHSGINLWRAEKG